MRFVWILLVVLAGGVAGALFTRFESSAPIIRGRTQTLYVGTELTHEFQVMDEGMGVEHVRVWIEAGENSYELFSEKYEGSRLMGATLSMPRRVEVTFRPAELGLAEGRATLYAEALDYSWRGNLTRIQVPIVIDTKPPRISVQTGLTYVRRGGSELAVYELNEEVAKHGVRLGEEFFPGFPHPIVPRRYVAFYALAADTGPGIAPAVIAEDRAGNRTAVPLAISVIERSFSQDRIVLSDEFLELKVPEILGGEQDDLLAGYLKINGEMRRENAAQIREVCANSSEERLWKGPFLQLPLSQVGAKFGDKRTYEYQGRTVDAQVHMGYDLAATARSPAPAGNDGVVVFAGDLGIYGKSVIIDHGMSVFSLYGHLSELSVDRGQAVARGEPVGRTGSTGLAGGDHLHYAMMVGGVFVDPLEWFDKDWIAEHIEVKFGLPGEAEAAP